MPDENQNDWINLNTHAIRAQDYEYGAIAGKFYPRNSMPPDPEIIADITAALRAQQILIDAGEPGRATRTWLIAPAENARLWDEWFEKGIAAIGWDELGDISAYEDAEAIKERLIAERGGDAQPTNGVRACMEFVHSMREGDIVYAKRGRREIVGVGTVVGPYRYEETRPEYKNVRDVRWEKRGDWELPGITLPLKTLTDISNDKELLAELRKLLIPPRQAENTPRKFFDLEAALSNAFIPRQQFQEIKRVWADKKNIILQGPPGVGKTFIAKRLAYALMGYEDESHVEMVQFHQSYSYEDFVQGFRPTATGLRLKEGRFYSFCERARQDPSSSYVFIIDEINRGNLSKIFGELMLLIEADKRSSKWAMALAYSENNEAKFFVPENVYVLGMMNTADRSLSLVDYALRRRFAFFALDSMVSSKRFDEHLAAVGVPKGVSEAIIERLRELNDFIADKNKSGLGAGFCIGHSYFIPTEEGDSCDFDWYLGTLNAQVFPLLEEYWFDNDEMLARWRKALAAPL